MLKNSVLRMILIILLLNADIGTQNLNAQDNPKKKLNQDSQPKLGNSYGIEHIVSQDISLIDSAFQNGYTDNIVNANIDGKKLLTLNIQSTNGNVYHGGGQTSYSTWVRDIYWGMLGWAQAGDESVLQVMKSSLQLLVMAKNKNQAIGQSKVWPLNDKRFYIPQAYTTGLKIAMDFFPWCSESQTDFLLLAHNYWKLSGDRQFIDSIWSDIVYVTRTLELLDTNGNSLPDALQGSYDYQGVGLNTEEPLMCAKTSMAYNSVATLARMLGKSNYADSLAKRATRVKEMMNKSIDEGGLVGPDGYYINMRKIGKGEKGIDDRFIPYENLVPMWCGMTNHNQDEAIFSRLDDDFIKYYDLAWGPMYCAPAAHNEQSVMNCSSVTWLAFMDVYLRGIKGHDANRPRIFNMLMQHAHDAGGVPFPEGAGIYGNLTGGAGRLWDNGNFFHMLICGVYGVEKSKDGISLTAPNEIDGTPLTELKNFCWRKAVYNFKWIGKGKNIKSITLDGNKITSTSGVYKLNKSHGSHKIEIVLY